jgi:type III secretion system FlhB-like substrate exporter
LVRPRRPLPSRYRDRELARLLASVELGTEIPRALYVAVAEVIAFAYRLSGRTSVLGGQP